MILLRKQALVDVFTAVDINLDIGNYYIVQQSLQETNNGCS